MCEGNGVFQSLYGDIDMRKQRQYLWKKWLLRWTFILKIISFWLREIWAFFYRKLQELKHIMLLIREVSKYYLYCVVHLELYPCKILIFEPISAFLFIFTKKWMSLTKKNLNVQCSTHTTIFLRSRKWGKFISDFLIIILLHHWIQCAS